MGTYTFDDKCKHCNATITYEEDYKTGELWAVCPACGWQFEAILVVGADGQIVIGPDGKYTYAVTDNRAIGQDDAPVNLLVIDSAANQ